MQILANALPGFRDLRAPVIAGYMWLLFAWLVVDPDLSHRPVGQPDAAIYDLGQRVGHIGIAVGVSIAAYLLGSVSQVIADGARGAWAAFVTGWYYVLRGARYSSPQGIATERSQASWLAYVARLFDVRPAANPAAEELPELYQRARATLESRSVNGPADRDQVEKLQQRFDRAAAEAQRELTLPATLLVGKEPALFGEVDRLRAEGELRLAIVPPLVALMVAAAQNSGWWLLGLPFIMVLLDQGVRRERDSRNLIANAISRGNIKSESIERLRDWIDSGGTDFDALRSK